ncbi:twin-arginine translocation pathway signal [Mycolicibacterium agri]|uniref:Twin-arginine translocation pathway signal n=1 Tax=Mycolicibacterium agri TaxID=36811 RepID=A0A2A7N0D3_MYCAG|nr:twin-arginine translocation pathway signal [Mycolicibacterium agri]
MGSFPSGRVTRRAIIKGALAAPLIGLAVSTFDPPRAAAANGKLIDFTELQVPADQIAAAGYTGALVYVSELRPGATFDFKPVTRKYADALRALGLQVVSCYQYGKPGWPTPSDFTRGYDGGVADAQTASRLHAAAGGPDTAPIFFSIDEDIDQSTWKSVAVNWLRGINSVLGVERTGVYGHAGVCKWAIADGVIGQSTTPGYRWAWQTRAWSDGVRAPAAVLYQRVIVTASDPGISLGGSHVDENDILAADYGQWDLDR